MLKADVLSHFGTQQKVAAAIGISQRAVSGWGEVVPMKRALQIEQATNGELKADLAHYIGGDGTRPQ